MKKLALFIAMTIIATSLFAIGVFAVDGAMADAVPATYGVLADFNPEAITADLSAMIGDQAAVEITGSKGITSLALETPGSVKDSVGLTLKEENGEKFVRFENKENYVSKYSQLYLNLDPAVFTAAEEFYFTITFRLNQGYTCTDGNGRAVLARLVDGVQNNCVIVTADDLAAKDLTQWTTLTFTFTPANAPYVMRLITFCNPGQYIDVKDFKVYAGSVAPETEPVTEAVTTEAVTTEAAAGGEATPPTGDYTVVLFAASLLAIAAAAVLAKKKVRD
ncbi:MAG: hypothetical protein E7619_05220 [Ruminococcaceae bacterium]|nr:hypothetical protein [Oscillospiraceae bacterium]